MKKQKILPFEKIKTDSLCVGEQHYLGTVSIEAYIEKLAENYYFLQVLAKNRWQL